jgi:hypothetical protein
MWRTPEELAEIGFDRSRVVMINEAHDADKRCIRTRAIGRRMLPTAHRAEVRHLAMECLWPDLARQANSSRRLPEEDGGYTSQPDMRALIQDALDLGWTLIAYEPALRLAQVRASDLDWMNWRELAAAQNLVAAFTALPESSPLLVWCGWNHHMRGTHQTAHGAWVMMGYHFVALSGISHFAIDQTVTLRLPHLSAEHSQLLKSHMPTLEAFGGTAGFLADEVQSLDAALSAVLPADGGLDAFILSTQNSME